MRSPSTIVGFIEPLGTYIQSATAERNTSISPTKISSDLFVASKCIARLRSRMVCRSERHSKRPLAARLCSAAGTMTHDLRRPMASAQPSVGTGRLASRMDHHEPPWRRSQRFENPRRTHAGTNAHRHHAVLELAPAQTADQGGDPHGPGRAERMAKRDRAAERVDPVGVQADVLDHGERLRGECLVEFDPVEIVLPDAGLPAD